MPVVHQFQNVTVIFNGVTYTKTWHTSMDPKSFLTFVCPPGGEGWKWWYTIDFDGKVIEEGQNIGPFAA